ncbi:protein lin-52 homolog [Episyrphus balteatus]|uniref:protein lin-52 homolog n=1 Tax=Episyrphus balteatus TaxID=286459 RepID=UPI002485D712|nr:protein lin-52 homolog [Episyrphus balteatus]
MSERSNLMRRRLLNGSSTKDESDEEALISLEKLDRASPDLWPEKIPGITDFIAMSDTPIHTSSSSWSKGLTQEEVHAMHELGVYSTNGLIMEIKKLYDEAYQLGVIEAKEMTRGKYLGIFNNVKKKTPP